MLQLVRFVSTRAFSFLIQPNGRVLVVLNRKSKFKLSVTTSQPSGLQLRRKLPRTIYPYKFNSVKLKNYFQVSIIITGGYRISLQVFSLLERMIFK